jgi:hypothetical protein
MLQAAGHQERALGFSQASATVRLVRAAWKAVHDALVTRLVLRRETTDEAMGILVLRVPAVASIEVKVGGAWGVDGRGAASSEQPACAHLSRHQLAPQRVRQGAAGH